jgi:hypothetical protein
MIKLQIYFYFNGSGNLIDGGLQEFTQIQNYQIRTSFSPPTPPVLGART